MGLSTLPSYHCMLSALDIVSSFPHKRYLQLNDILSSIFPFAAFRRDRWATPKWALFSSRAFVLSLSRAQLAVSCAPNAAKAAKPACGSSQRYFSEASRASSLSLLVCCPQLLPHEINLNLLSQFITAFAKNKCWQATADADADDKRHSSMYLWDTFWYSASWTWTWPESFVRQTIGSKLIEQQKFSRAKLL